MLTGVALTLVHILLAELAGVSRVASALEPSQVVLTAPVDAGLRRTVIDVRLAQLAPPARRTDADPFVEEVFTSGPICTGVGLADRGAGATQTDLWFSS